MNESEDFDEMATLKKLIAKKRAHYAGDEKKLTAYLARQGFSYDDIKNVLNDHL
jgi:SOS response regulatory protein OraA/RecX